VVAALALLLPDGLILPAVVFTPSLLVLERNAGLAGRLIGVRWGSLLRPCSGLLRSVSGLIIGQVRRQVGTLAEGRV
jgi:hypothetical protein